MGGCFLKTLMWLDYTNGFLPAAQDYLPIPKFYLWFIVERVSDDYNNYQKLYLLSTFGRVWRRTMQHVLEYFRYGEISNLLSVSNADQCCTPPLPSPYVLPINCHVKMDESVYPVF